MSYSLDEIIRLMKSFTVFLMETLFLLSETINNFIKWISFLEMDTKI